MYNGFKVTYWLFTMKTPVGTLLVIDPIHIFSVVAPFVYEVVKETDKSVEITPIKEDGTYLNRDNTKTIRKTTIVSVLEKIEDFEPFKKMNQDLQDLYNAYTDKKKELEAQIVKVKKQSQAK